MSTQHPDLFAALASPFESHEVKVRSQGGRQLHYITARVAMNRLDNVLGPEGWWDEYEPHENSVQCKLTIRLPDGSTLAKCDAGGYAGMSDEGDDDKSGYSDAFKRVCVKFGIARYLYRDGVPKFVQERVGAGPDHRDAAPPPDGRQQVNETFRQPAQGGRPEGNWSGQRTDRTQSDHSAQRQGGNGGQHGGQSGGNSYGDRPPTSGKALFAWCKRIEEEQQVGMLKFLNGWGKLQEFPPRMIEWDAAQVAAAHAEGVRKLGTQADRGDAYEDALSN